jgi:hypothetical protein
MLAPKVAVAVKVPAPMLVKVTGPDTVYEVPDVPTGVTVAFVTVRVVEIVAAFAMAPAKIAKAQVFIIPVINIVSSEKTYAGKVPRKQLTPRNRAYAILQFLTKRYYRWLSPPSTARICPVTKFDARKK